MENKYSGMLAWEEGISYLCVAETKDKMQIDMNELQDNYNPLAIPSEFVSDVHSIIERGRQQAYASVGQISIATFGMLADESLRRSRVEKPVLRMASNSSRTWQKHWCHNMATVTANAILTIIGNSICFSPTLRL